MRVVNALIVRCLRQDMNDCIHLVLLLNSAFILEDRILHVNEIHSLVLIVAYREANKGLYMVARKFLLNCSAWLCLGPA